MSISPRIMRIDEVKATTGMSRSTIYNMAQEGTFPKPIKLGGHSSGWIDQEVYGWIKQRILERDQ